MDSNTEQFFKVQLKWASANFDAEHHLRLAAEQRVAGTRELLMDLAKSLLASELDAVQKQNVDFNRWSDGELMQWTKQQLKGYLHQLRALTGEAGRRRLEQAIQEIQQLRAENAQLSQHNAHLQAEVRHAPTYQATIADREVQIAKLQRELADARADLEIVCSEAARPASPGAAVLSDMPEAAERMPRSQSAERGPVFQASLWPAPTVRSSSAAPDWYAAWRDATSLDVWARQQKLIELVGDGDAFFRAEIVATLSAAGLLNDDPDRPGGTAQRLFTTLLERELIEEIDGGYGASVARPLMLTERGREAYRQITGRTLPQSLFGA